MNEQQFKALPVDQRKAHQERLQALGLYTGTIDGAWGAGTKAAFESEAKQAAERSEQERQSRLEQQRIENERLRLETEQGKANTENAAAEAKLARENLYQEQASSPEGIATQSAAWLASPAATGALGYYAGGKLNDRLNEGQANRNVTLRGAAADRLRGLTTRDGATTGVKLAGAMPPSNRTMRVASRMAPHLGLGGLAVGKGTSLLMGGEEDQPFYSRMGDVAAGTGYIGFGSGLLKRGIEQGASPKVSPDAQALSIINSNQLRRPSGSSKLADALARGQIIDAEVIPDAPKQALPPPSQPSAPEAPPAPTANPHNPGTGKYMAWELKHKFGVKGTSGMHKAELATKLSEAIQEHGGKRTVGKRLPKGTGKAAIPLAVGSYMAATGDSEAADGSLGERAGNAAGNFAVGAGAAYGGSKLADALAKYAPNAMRALGAGAGMATPGAMVDMTDEFASPEARNWAARNLPEFMQVGAVGQARDMATVPEANPQRQSMGPRLEDPGIQNRIKRMSQGGASPEQIAHFLNGISF